MAKKYKSEPAQQYGAMHPSTIAGNPKAYADKFGRSETARHPDKKGGSRATNTTKHSGDSVVSSAKSFFTNSGSSTHRKTKTIKRTIK